jgi:riboflavin kinase / FMN adenylyltransferase
MKIFRHIAGIPREYKGAVVAIGNFDGVHRGHQALIRRAIRHAEVRGVPCAVLTFEPTSREFFYPGAEPIRLTPFRSKAHILAKLGVDAMFALPFDSEMAHHTAQDFVLELLVKSLEVDCVVVGSDFRFGAQRAGNGSVLAYMGEMEGFGVEIFPTVMAGMEEKISSTLIRTLLRDGHPDDASRLLGHPFVIEGRVEHGEKRGRTLGFPTLNMHLDGYIRPAYGIYAVRTSVIEDEVVTARYDGVANFGIRPMFEIEAPLMETYLFDFSGDLYGKQIAVELVAYLRPEAKFPNVEALKAQMAQDVRDAQQALKG